MFLQLLLLLPVLASGKVFERCELAKELLRLGVEAKDVPTWVCIARHESGYNTSAVGRLNGDGSEDHGLFQISDKYWCSPQGWACNLPCSLLEDDDITDDWKCARRVYKQHKILSGSGFEAWAVYKSSCSGDTSEYVKDCEDKVEKQEEEDMVESHSAREGNNAAKVQVVDLEMMEKTEPKKTGRRLWKPWTWEI